MAARIRLQRAGRKKRAFFRLVVADNKANRDGRYVERLGHYDPVAEPAELVVDADRALYWLQQGAQPSDTARSLLKSVGVWQAYKAPWQVAVLDDADDVAVDDADVEADDSEE